MVEPPKTNNDRKTNTMYHMHTLGASKCMHVVHSVGFAMGVGDGWVYLTCFCMKQCPGRFLDIFGQDLRVFKSNWLHVVIF